MTEASEIIKERFCSSTLTAFNRQIIRFHQVISASNYRRNSCTLGLKKKNGKFFIHFQQQQSMIKYCILNEVNKKRFSSAVTLASTHLFS